MVLPCHLCMGEFNTEKNLEQSVTHTVHGAVGNISKKQGG